MRADYVAANLELLASLPLPRGSERVRTESEGYERSAYATNAYFRAPRGTTARRLAAFYFARLRPDWRLVERTVFAQAGNSIIVLGFRRGAAGTWLNTANLYSRGQFELIVDHRAWEHRGAA